MKSLSCVCTSCYILQDKFIVFMHSVDNSAAEISVCSSDSFDDPCLVPWVESCGLSMFDKEQLVSGQWLNASHIAAGQNLLQQAYPHQCGLQDTHLLSQKKRFDSPEEFVQVIHIEPNHWACLSNKFVSSGCSSHTVNLYDSLHTLPKVDGSIVKEVCLILKAKESTVSINLINVQLQAGQNDCGLFVLAMATDLCRGVDPFNVLYHQAKMRPHLAECYERSVLSPFPSSDNLAKRKCCILSTTTIDVYCICRQPEVKPMIGCDKCSDWYHTKCVGVTDHMLKLLDNEDTLWFCPSCTCKFLWV